MALMCNDCQTIVPETVDDCPLCTDESPPLIPVDLSVQRPEIDAVTAALDAQKWKVIWAGLASAFLLVLFIARTDWLRPQIQMAFNTIAKVFGTTGGEDAYIGATITTVLLTWVVFIIITAIISFALAITLPAWALFIYRSDVEKYPDDKIARIDNLAPSQMFHGPNIDDDIITGLVDHLKSDDRFLTLRLEDDEQIAATWKGGYAIAIIASAFYIVGFY